MHRLNGIFITSLLYFISLKEIGCIWSNKWKIVENRYDQVHLKKEIIVTELPATARNQLNLHNSSCKSNEFSCAEKCIPKTYLCDGQNDCKDGADEKNCPEPIKPIRWRNAPIIQACLVVAILLLVIVLVITYCWFHNKQDGDMDILSMARHRGKSIAEISVTDANDGDKSMFWKDGDTVEPTILHSEPRDRGKSIINHSYDNVDGRFTNVDSHIDMFDDGQKIPDHTIRRSSSAIAAIASVAANPALPKEKVLPSIIITNTIKETTGLDEQEQSSTEEQFEHDINALDNYQTPPRSSSFTNPLYNDPRYKF